MAISVDQIIKRARRLAAKGENEAARDLLRDVLRKFPNNPRALEGLKALDAVGARQPLKRDDVAFLEREFARLNQLRATGHPKAFAEGVRALSQQYPGVSAVKNALGTVFAEAGDHEAAIVAYRDALRLEPIKADARNNLGISLCRLGRIEEGIAEYKRAIADKPDYAFAYNNIGNALQALRRHDEAVEWHRKAIEISPDQPAPHANLGGALRGIGRYRDALASYDRAIEIAPSFAEAYNDRGNALMDLGRHAEASASFHKAIDLNPRYAMACNNLGNCLEELGDFSAAIKQFERAVAINPAYTQAHRSLARQTRFTPDDPRLSRLQALNGRAGLSDSDRVEVDFALAKAFEDLGEDAKAFDHITRGNALRRKALDYDIDQDRRLFAAQAEFYKNGAPTVLSDVECGVAPKPIFIVGMPRSGTTLVEQILACHSEVLATGENRFLDLAIGRTGWRDVPGSKDKLLAVRRLYYDLCCGDAFERNIFTEKTPVYFRWIGVILSAFPEARIVHVRRDARATCWSIYKQNFGGQGYGFGYDLGDLTEYYKIYVGLMDVFDRAFPGKIHHLNYERLTEDPETVTRALLEGAGLEWQDECLEPQRAGRVVRTASAHQVREGIYRGSSESWRRFEPYLDEMIAALEGV